MSELRPIPVVVGTAGHIDHGKSALIEALTGVHPDRWREERERGITLDLGYAQLAYPDGLEVGFVDVPGHERLVRKMVAGATGMGAALLVVACDDGVMPQTREHFEVLQLLGVDRGIVVLTKADLADDDVLELVRADVELLVAGTTWEAAPVLPVSAHTGDGLDALRGAVRVVAESARRSPDAVAAFRMPVQRSFALHGAGTVATGIVAGAAVAEGDEVEVLPAGVRSRVRRVQVHGRAAGASAAGLRTALNLPNADPEQCKRGTVVAAPGSLQVGKLLRAVAEPLPGAPPWKHGAEIQVLSGTAAITGRIFLPPEDGAQGGIVDLELDEAVALAPGDRLLLRRPTPAANQGAGRFLAFATRRLKKRDESERAALQRLADALNDPAACAAAMLELKGQGGATAEAMAAHLGWTAEATRSALEAGCGAGRVRRIAGDRYVGGGSAGELEREVLGVIARFQESAPHRLRIPVAALRQPLGKQKARTLEQSSDEVLATLGLRRRRGLEWELLDVAPPAELLELAARVSEALQAAGLAPPDFESLAGELGVTPGRVGAAVEYLVDSAQAITPADGLAFAAASVEELRQAVVAQFADQGVDLPALRDRFGTSRKFLMPLMEYLDACGVTMRRGPNRILRDPEAPIL